MLRKGDSFFVPPGNIYRWELQLISAFLLHQIDNLTPVYSASSLLLISFPIHFISLHLPRLVLTWLFFSIFLIFNFPKTWESLCLHIVYTILDNSTAYGSKSKSNSIFTSWKCLRWSRKIINLIIFFSGSYFYQQKLFFPQLFVIFLQFFIYFLMICSWSQKLILLFRLV